MCVDVRLTCTMPINRSTSREFPPAITCLILNRIQGEVEIHVLVRPRVGDFIYSDKEFSVILEDIRLAKDAGADGEQSVA